MMGWRLQPLQHFARALHFLYRLSYGSARDIDALRRNQELDEGLAAWIAKAKRVVEDKLRMSKEELKLANQKKAKRVPRDI